MRNALAPALLLLLAASPARAAIDPAQKCTAVKLGAAGKAGEGNALCTMKASLGGTPTDPACLAKSDARIAAVFAGAEKKGGCVSTGNAGTVAAVLDDVTGFAEVQLGDDGSAAGRKCAASRRKATGKLVAAMLGCASKGVLKGSSSQEIALCKYAAIAKMNDAFAKSAAAGGCATGADENDTSAFVIDLLDTVSTAVTAPPASPTPTPVPTPTPGPVSFASDLQPILTSRCASCHGSSGPSAGLSLVAGSAYAELVNVNSTECAGTKLVAPSDADASYLVHKLEGTGPCFVGSRMPLGGPFLSAADVAKFRNWIDQGALDN